MPYVSGSNSTEKSEIKYKISDIYPYKISDIYQRFSTSILITPLVYISEGDHH